MKVSKRKRLPHRLERYVTWQFPMRRHSRSRERDVWDYVVPALEAARRGQARDDLVTEMFGDDAWYRGEQTMTELANAVAFARKVTQPTGADPETDLAVAMVARLCPVPQQSPGYDATIDPDAHLRGVIDAFRPIAALKIDEAVLPKPRKRGRQPNDTVTRAAVRAAMHYLHDRGERHTGGWRERARPGKRTAKHRTDDEWNPQGAAAYIAGVLRNARVSAKLSEIKQHMAEYQKFLLRVGKLPGVEDYIRIDVDDAVGV